jgi:sugar O-acyltransferase (sialic acid O-acetyltransferase NeuD family)
MNKKIILVGGGGHCFSCIDVINLENKFEIFGIIDNKSIKIKNYVYLGNDGEIYKKKFKVNNILISIGQITNSKIRKNIYNKLLRLEYNFPTIISPLSYLSKDSKIGKGTIVHHNAFINSFSSIGNNCIINTGCIIEHGAKVGNHSHISTSSVVNGGVEIGECTFLGSNSTVKEGIKIGKNCVIGAGIFINKNIKDNSIIK